MDVSWMLPGAIVLAIVGVAHVLLEWWIRRKARQQEAAPAAGGSRFGRAWLARGLRDVLAPLLLLIWIQGGKLAAGIALAGGAAAGEWTAPVRTAVAWTYGVSVLAAAFWLLSRAGRVIEQVLLALPARSENTWDDVMLPIAGRAARRLLPLLALILAAPALAVSPGLEQVFRNGTSLLLIGMVAFVLWQAVDAAAAVVLQQHRLDERDNLRARSIHTQVVVLKKIAASVIGVFALASMLMVFESVRQFGASILASAGIASIIVGLAAQRSIATLLAGFQIALTQPIRVDDVVIVENEWGRIEEITLTYVVVCIWDRRRLVLPITYFIERPFQNWTRTSADILGSVFLYVDYTVPMDALRRELTRILEASSRWDGHVNVLQVTDARERTLEIRALVSAADASLAWDLRCEVREGLVEFLERQYPGSLPRVRASLERGAVGAM